jgi:hypothetical protein
VLVFYSAPEVREIFTAGRGLGDPTQLSIHMTAEGGVGVAAAIAAGSVALLGFALDSVIEAAASIIVIGRLTGARTLSETAERRAHKAVAVTFFLIAPYIAADAITLSSPGSVPPRAGRALGWRSPA